MMTAAGGKQKSHNVDDRWKKLAADQPEKYESEGAMWEDMYITQGLSMRDIGRKFGTSGKTVRNRLKKWGVKMRPVGGANNPWGRTGRPDKEDVPTTWPFRCKKCGDRLYGEQKKVGLCVYCDPSIGVVAREVEGARVRY